MSNILKLSLRSHAILLGLESADAFIDLAEQSEQFLLLCVMVLEAFLILFAIAILDVLQTLDVVAQSDIRSLLLSDSKLELLYAMLHIAVHNANARLFCWMLCNIYVSRQTIFWRA